MKLPLIKGVTALIVALKKDIDDDSRADEETDTPSMCVTVGCDTETGNWCYQTGDNSYSGGAYGYPHWGVVSIDRRSNSKAIARAIVNQIADVSGQ